MSRYEEFLTNCRLESWNQTLALLGLGLQFLTAAFLGITEIAIKIFFKLSSRGRPSIKKTFSFKRLNLLYSLGLVVVTLSQIFFREKGGVAYRVHFLVSM